MTNKLYDIVKYTALIVLPAIATFWSAVGLVWSVPHTDQVVATIVAVNVLLGALVGVSAAQYKKRG